MTKKTGKQDVKYGSRTERKTAAERAKHMCRNRAERQASCVPARVTTIDIHLDLGRKVRKWFELMF